MLKFSPIVVANAVWSLIALASRTATTVKRYQTGVITIANGATTGTATLANAIVIANSRCDHAGYRGAAAAPATLVITNTTTITAERSGTTNDEFVSFNVEEQVGVST